MATFTNSITNILKLFYRLNYTHVAPPAPPAQAPVVQGNNVIVAGAIVARARNSVGAAFLANHWSNL